MRNAVLHALGLLLFCAGTTWAKDVKIHGFITTINSPTSFEIDDYKITRDVQLILEVEKDESGAATANFNPQDFRVGTEVEIRGEWNESVGELKAKSIKVFLDDTRKIKRTALVHATPVLSKTELGSWIGMVKADGQRVAISESTLVTVKQNKGERRQSKLEKSDVPKDDSVKLASADYVNLDTFIHYEGTRQVDGSVLTSKVEFQHGELEDGRASFGNNLRRR